MHRVVLLTTSLLLGMLFGSYAITKYEQSTFKPWSWNQTPIVANCYGEELNYVYIEKTVRYWEKKGHEFAFIVQWPPDSVCDYDFLDGFIILKKARLRDPTLAATKRKQGILKNIKAALIEFSPGTYRLDNVMEHEFGHALGYSHVEIDGHIMHPNFERMSPKFWIPD